MRLAIPRCQPPRDWLPRGPCLHHQPLLVETPLEGSGASRDQTSIRRQTQPQTMPPLQNSLYFREWGRVRAACKQQGFPIPDRHSLHVKALGQDKSHLNFSNEDFDQVLAEFRAISQPDNLAAQLRQQDMPRRRLLYSIRRLADEPY